jgi:hypothetical protein
MLLSTSLLSPPSLLMRATPVLVRDCQWHCFPSLTTIALTFAVASALSLPQLLKPLYC